LKLNLGVKEEKTIFILAQISICWYFYPKSKSLLLLMNKDGKREK